MSPEEILKDKIMFLDCALTRKTYKEVALTWKNSNFDLEDFITGREYYLSDGGYSRIWFSDISFQLRLSSNSLDTSTSNWQYCKELITDIEDKCANYYNWLDTGENFYLDSFNGRYDK